MHVIAVDITVVEGLRDDFLPLLLRHARRSAEEPGCRRFEVCEDPDDPATFFVYEVYDDLAAIEAHRATPHFRAWGPATSDMIAAKRSRVLTLLDP